MPRMANVGTESDGMSSGVIHESKKVTPEHRPGGAEGVSPVHCWGREFRNEGQASAKAEVRACVVCSRNIKKASVSGRE